tara:strand:+ start:472 stop:783 length:312 start_codon:yes stop_codon:yes gene_type:complete
MSKIYEYDETVAFEQRETVPIRITDGKYEGVAYQYGTIKFIEEGENVRCNFTYTLIDNPNNIEEDQDFINQLGEILVEVLNDEIEESEEDFLRETETSDSEDS